MASWSVRLRRLRNFHETQNLQHAGERAGGWVAPARVSLAAQSGPSSHARFCMACERARACP
eukprot:1350765-Pyramimonas_sp.AAC.1